MDHHSSEPTQGETVHPPGTAILVAEDSSARRSGVVLSPTPSNDPNDPLVWPVWRKVLNFGLISAMSVIVSCSIAMQSVFWKQMLNDMEVTYQDLANTISVALVGLAVGCVFFVPFTVKYGRRLSFVIPTAVLATMCWWATYMKTRAELYAIALLLGLAGATSQTAIEMSIQDLFYIHQRGTANGMYVATIMIGNFLVPMAAGAQAVAGGWRSSFRTCAIVTTVLTVAMVFLFEETKFVRPIDGLYFTDPTGKDLVGIDAKDKDLESNVRRASASSNAAAARDADQPVPRPNSYLRRMRLVTPTPVSLWKTACAPLYSWWLPHVFFSSIQLAALQCFYTVLSSTTALLFGNAPYDFNAAQIGYMSAGLCIGAVLGALYGGPFTDLAILRLAKRNNGLFEPEMRLYLLLLPSITMAIGLIVNGICADKGYHWIYPSIGRVIFGFGNSAATDIFFTMVIDAYPNLVGQTFVSVVFFQNAISIAGPFSITPWIDRMGITNMFIMAAVFGLFINCFGIPLAYYGKRARIALAPRYYRLSRANLYLR